MWGQVNPMFRTVGRADTCRESPAPPWLTFAMVENIWYMFTSDNWAPSSRPQLFSPYKSCVSIQEKVFMKQLFFLWY
jgi:hypothetical protein